MNKIKDILTLCRVEQYIKNLFVFAPLFFSFNFTYENIYYSIITFILFCILASSIYILNDILDVNEDRLHEIKKNRPIAIKTISSDFGIKLSLIFLLISLSLSYLINLYVSIIFIIYFIINILYSYKLKHIPIIDITIISTGFILRLYAGGYAINEMITYWIIIMTFILAFFIALAKRRDDVFMLSKGYMTRKSIDGYNLKFINISLVVIPFLIIILYLAFTFDNDVILKFNTKYLWTTTVFVFLGLFRYVYLIFYKNLSHDPTKLFLSDKYMQFIIVSWLSMFYILVKVI